MPDTTATIIENVYEAWNRHDAAAIVASFAAGGVYADPLTRVDLSGDNLTNHVQSLLDVIRDFRISVFRTIADGDAAATVWTIDGTWDGKLGALTAAETPVRFEGTDVFEFDDGCLRRLRRMWLRCSLGHPNEATRADGRCDVCGEPLPPAQPNL
jgi:predicted ester cyclase